MDAQKRVEPYPDPPMARERLNLVTYEYRMPFNYPNITVQRRYLRGKEFHGVEINAVNSVGVDDRHDPPDYITVTEDHPIVRVVVIGSACTPPGFVQLEAEPLEEFEKPVDVPGTSAVRYRIGNLWGMHLRADSWLSRGTQEVLDQDGNAYAAIPEARKQIVPGLRDYTLKMHYRENPLVGMSCATFEIPKSSRVLISGGSELCVWQEDNYPDDVHYSFSIIRTTVAVRE